MLLSISKALSIIQISRITQIEEVLCKCNFSASSIYCGSIWRYWTPRCWRSRYIWRVSGSSWQSLSWKSNISSCAPWRIYSWPSRWRYNCSTLTYLRPCSLKSINSSRISSYHSMKILNPFHNLWFRWSRTKNCHTWSRSFHLMFPLISVSS